MQPTIIDSNRDMPEGNCRIGFSKKRAMRVSAPTSTATIANCTAVLLPKFIAGHLIFARGA